MFHNVVARRMCGLNDRQHEDGRRRQADFGEVRE
jgi:hypothetical protein